MIHEMNWLTGLIKMKTLDSEKGSVKKKSQEISPRAAESVCKSHSQWRSGAENKVSSKIGSK